MPNNYLQTVSKFSKQADIAADMAKEKAWRNVRNLLMTGLGVGAAARGAIGLTSLLGRNTSDRQPPRMGPVTAPVPVPYEEEDDDVVRKLACAAVARMSKQAGLTSEVPWYWPAAMTAAGGGLYAGWKGIDAILDARRRAAQKDEFENAKNEFESAIMEQYSKGSGKRAADDSLGAALDNLFEKVAQVNEMTKTAEPGFWEGAKNTTLNAYGAYSGITGLLAGLWAYNKAKGSSRGNILRAAQRKRLAKRYAQLPPSIVAVPEPRRLEDEGDDAAAA